MRERERERERERRRRRRRRMNERKRAFFNNTLGKHSEALKIPNFFALERDPRFYEVLIL
jgi:hypothetical protein